MKKSVNTFFTRILLIALLIQLVPADMFSQVFAAPSNAAPEFIGAGGRYIVALNAPSGTVVGDVLATDADLDNITYGLVSGNGFAVSASGQITLTNSATHDTGALRTITVSANDGTNRTTASFEVLITTSIKLAKTGATRESFSAYGDNVAEFQKNSNNLANPTATVAVDKIDFTSDSFNHVGYRYRAYLKPSVTGQYKFFISGDDDAELYLGTNSQPESKRKIAYTNGEVPYRVWNKNAFQQSAPVHLVKGQIYYLETLYKEAWWGESLSVAWQVPGGNAPVNLNQENVIPSGNLFQIDSFDWQAPETPRSFNVEKVDGNGVVLKWYEAFDTSGIDEYRLTIDGGATPVKVDHVTKNNIPVYTYTHPVTSGQHTYSLVAVDNDGNISTATKTLTINASTAYDAIDQAMTTGDSTLLTDPNPIIEKAFQEMTTMSTRTSSLIDQFYNNVTTFNYKPDAYGKDFIKPNGLAADRIFTILNSNINGIYPLAVAGWTSNTFGSNRIVAFGDSPFKFSGFTSVLQNVFKWLINGNSSQAISTTADTKIGIYSNDNLSMKNWLKSALNLSDANIIVCTSITDTSCFREVGLDMLIVSPRQDSKTDDVLVALQSVIDANIPILYTKDFASFEPRQMDSEIMNKLGISFEGTNYWTNSSAEYNGNNIEVMKATLKQTKFDDLKVALNHLRNGDWQDGATTRMNECKESYCPNDTAKNYLNQNFYSGVRDYLKTNLDSLDSKGTVLFNSNELNKNRLMKLMVLLGDVYRQEIKYSINFRTGEKDRNRWFRAYFADHTVYNNRLINPQQPDLGSFSKSINVAALKQQGKVYQDKRVTLQTKSDGYFSATGYYALPGETLTITRKDAGSGSLSVAINSIRSGSTKEFDGHTRPKYLMSTWITLNKDIPVKITNPYGGPIQINVGQTDAEQTIEVEIDNIGKHATWKSTATTGEFTSTEFAQLLEESDYDWAEFITPGFQLHSTRKNMLLTLADPSWNTPSKLADATMENLFKAMYNLAGFSGEGLALNSSVQSFCNGKGWGSNCLDNLPSNPHKLNALTHAISDQATCGFGCSGNPYDYYWEYGVIGWGEAHEIGHNIQSFHVANKNGGNTTGEVTNNIFAVYTMYKWNKMHPDEYRRTHTYDQDTLFKMLNYAQTQSNPKEFIYQQLWEGNLRSDLFGDANVGLYKLSFYLQLIQQNKDLFGQDGWDLITSMYLHERLTNRAKVDEATWNAKKTSLGYSSYTWDEAKKLSTNDNLLIAISYLTGKDQRNHFDLYGIYYNDKAANQVQSLPDVEKKFYYYSYLPAVTNDTNWTGVSLGSVPVDGNLNVKLPKTPVNLIFPKMDEMDANYANTTNFVSNKAVELSSLNGTSGKVTFKVKQLNNGSPTIITGCKDIMTSKRGTGPGSNYEGVYVADEQEAICTWVPEQTGNFEIFADFTPIDGTVYTSSSSKKLLLSVLPESSAPTISNISTTSPSIGDTVTITGTNLSNTTTATFNGVNATIVSKSSTEVRVTIPNVLISQSVGQLLLTASNGFKVYSPEITLSLPGIYFEQPTLTIAPNETVTPAVFSNRQRVSSGLTWTSSNTNVATVSSNGLVTAKSEGTATITAASGANTISLILEVKTVLPTGISVDQSILNLNANGTTQLKATFAPANASNQTVTWSSSNSNVATVSSDGLVTAIANGSAIITVRSNIGGFTARTVINVTDVVVNSVVLNTKALSLKPNDTATLTATVNPSNAVNRNITWTSSNPAVASVSSTGVVTAVSNGTATITVETVDGGFKSSAIVNVASVKLTKITLNSSKFEIQPNATSQLSTTLTPGATATLTWTSSNTKVATVSTNGLVKAIGNGTATITVKSETGIQAKTTVKVKALKPVKVVIDQTNIPSNLGAGQTYQLTAKLYYSNGSPVVANSADITWKSLKTDAATVDANGLVTIVDNTRNIKIVAQSKFGGKSDKIKN